MSNKFVLLLVLFASAVFVSGCIFDGNKGKDIESKFIPQNNLPAGYTYITTHETVVSIGNSSLNAIEGTYRYTEGYADIQVIKNDNPGDLITQYKLRYKDANYNPFEEITFNEHKATLVKDYSIRNSQQEPKFTVIWTNGSYMFIAFNEEPTDAQIVIALASATGY